jgi:hypothetical protein
MKPVVLFSLFYCILAVGCKNRGHYADFKVDINPVEKNQMGAVKRIICKQYPTGNGLITIDDIRIDGKNQYILVNWRDFSTNGGSGSWQLEIEKILVQELSKSGYANLILQ